jgi:hypothetical protein
MKKAALRVSRLLNDSSRRSTVTTKHMATHSDSVKPRYLGNSLLVIVGMLAQAPLWYQLPRSALGLDPSFVHPRWIEHSAFPYLFWMVKVPSWFWMLVMALAFVRLCRNYGWRLER